MKTVHVSETTQFACGKRKRRRTLFVLPAFLKDPLPSVDLFPRHCVGCAEPVLSASSNDVVTMCADLPRGLGVEGEKTGLFTF